MTRNIIYFMKKTNAFLLAFFMGFIIDLVVFIFVIIISMVIVSYVDDPMPMVGLTVLFGLFIAVLISYFYHKNRKR